MSTTRRWVSLHSFLAVYEEQVREEEYRIMSTYGDLTGLAFAAAHTTKVGSEPVGPRINHFHGDGPNDTMRGGRSASEGPNAHVHGVRLRDQRTADYPMTREEYRAKYGQ